jgi:hypothetical protein
VNRVEEQAMAEPNPATVFMAENVKLAEAVIQLLATHNIPAEAFTGEAHTVSEPVTGMSELSVPEELEIRVTDPAKVAEARDLLTTAESAAAVRAIREKRLQRTGTITAVCEECGKSSEWPADTMGTTDTCPNCGAYMDIPDPDDDWSGVDFGQAEEENETPE